MINGHGDDRHLYDVEIKYNFSSNVYHKGCPKPLLSFIKDHIESIQNYPSPAALELNTLAANHFQLVDQQFLFANGATELFYLIAQHYKGQSATIIGPTFSEYEDACRMQDIRIQHTLWKDIMDTSFTTDLVFLCNPNNPTGEMCSKTQIEHLLSTYPNTQFVIDEAYIEFTTQVESVYPLIEQYSNVIIIRSLTKTFTIPGLRLGYAIGPSHIIEQLSALKMPWSVNQLAILAGEYIFSNYKQIQFNAAELLAETEQFKTALQTIHYLEVVEGYTSYFLVKLTQGKAHALKTYLVHTHGLLIRDATNFVGLEGEYIRLAVQSETANKTLIKALKQWS